jgi:peptidyl-tRNA hydrolase, PTH1 family
MKLIVGLGNPGEKYTYTRHNIGFMVVEKLAKSLLPVGRSERAWVGEKKFTAEICKVSDDVLLAKPHTYMNRSGMAIQSLMTFFKIDQKDVWVVHDDIDLPIGKMRIRIGGSSAGHNGVDSIISALHFEDFVRFRLGIGKGKLDMEHTADHNLHRREIEKYVLSLFREEEVTEVKQLIKKAVKALDCGLKEGIEKAMNRYN